LLLIEAKGARARTPPTRRHIVAIGLGILGDRTARSPRGVGVGGGEARRGR
jgi:hypothetical protein